MTTTPTDRTAGASAPRRAVQPGEAAPAVTPGTPAGGAPLTPAPPAGRAWVVELPPGTPLLTSNHRLHRMALHRRNTELHALAITLARVLRLPRIECARVLVEYRRPARRHPLASAAIRDAGALTPMGKALIDGLVRAGVFPGDTVRHVVAEEYQFATEKVPLGQVVLTITEVTP